MCLLIYVSRRTLSGMKKIYIGGVLVILAMFYWSAVRPVIIRKSCARFAWDHSLSPGQAVHTKTGFDNNYSVCVRRRGL